MTATDALRAALGGDGEARTLTLDRGFQGLPDTAHGGSVLAFSDGVATRMKGDSAARLIGAKSLAGSYIRLVRSTMFTPSAPAPAIPMV